MGAPRAGMGALRWAQPWLPPALVALLHSTQELGIKDGALRWGAPVTTPGSQHDQTPGPQIS